MTRLMSRMACLALVAGVYGVVASCQHAGGGSGDRWPGHSVGHGGGRTPRGGTTVQPSGMFSRISPVPVVGVTSTVEGYVTFSVGPGVDGVGVVSSYTVLLGSEEKAGTSGVAGPATFTPRFTTEPLLVMSGGSAYLRGRWPMPRTTRRIGTTVNAVDEGGTTEDGSGGTTGGGGTAGDGGSAGVASSSAPPVEATYRGGVVVHTEASVDYVFFFPAGMTPASAKITVALNDGPKTVVLLSAGEYLELTGAPGGNWGTITPKKISDGGSARAVEVMSAIREAAKSAGYEEGHLPPVLNPVPPS
ncbi:MAG: hypothetical protein HRU70_09145 [Phycisphaeraceae bacterium]|nr:MAG: hypothetical protein HRU70_09145 [Phycisphaeraceae bacterium]